MCVLTPCRASEAPTSDAALRVDVAAQRRFDSQGAAALDALILFPDSRLLKELVESDNEDAVTFVRLRIETIRPRCEMLRTLPPERVKELVLLADSVLYQSRWLSKSCVEEAGIECKVQTDVGLSDLSHGAELLQQVLNGKRKVSPEAEAVLREFVELVGGEQVLDFPAARHDEPRAEDYKTALQFYRDFCAAASAPEEAQAIARLKARNRCWPDSSQKVKVKSGGSMRWRIRSTQLWYC